MAIKKHLEYSKKLDIIEGLEDLGPLGRKPKHATHALVFMARGIYSSWKIPIAYFFSNNSVNKRDLKELIIYVITNITKIGFSVRTLVCDQGTNNRGAINLLGASTENPYFYFEGQKIFCIYDVPHLFKSIRNNLIAHDFSLNGTIITFKDIVKTYQIDTESNSARALVKITDSHIAPNAFQKMSCKLALQMLSHSMAAAIKTCANNGELKSETAMSTANFLEIANNLFDCLNSKTLYSKNKFSCALSEKNPHTMETLKNGLETFRIIKKIDKVGNEKRPPCFDGIVQTILAVLSLYQEEKSDSVFFLMTNRLNQDIIENFFSIIRQKSGYNPNPTAKLFRTSFRIKSITSLLRPSEITNCEEDEDNYLEVNNKCDTIKCEQKDLVADDWSSASSSVSSRNIKRKKKTAQVTLEECSVVYYGGYLVRTCLKQFKCEECKQSLTKSTQLTDKKQLLILYKNYGTMYLTTPNDDVANIISFSMKKMTVYFTNTMNFCLLKFIIKLYKDL